MDYDIFELNIDAEGIDMGPSPVDAAMAADINGDGLDDLVLSGTIRAVLLQEECDARALARGTCAREVR